MARRKLDSAFARRLGAYLYEQRMSAGVTMHDLARGAGCSRSLISAVENGKTTPSVAILFAIADVLNFSVDSLRLPVDGPARKTMRDLLSIRQQLNKAEAKLAVIGRIIEGAEL